MVLVLANMKPKPLVGYKSHGMVLCASNADHTVVEPLTVPEGAAVGERVMVDGFGGEPATANALTKKKIAPKVLQVRAASPPASRTRPRHTRAHAPLQDCTTDDACVVTYKGKPWTTSAGPIKSTTLTKAVIA